MELNEEQKLTPYKSLFKEMAFAGKFGNYEVQVYTDHTPKHFHLETPHYEARIELDTLEVNSYVWQDTTEDVVTEEDMRNLKNWLWSKYTDYQTNWEHVRSLWNDLNPTVNGKIVTEIDKVTQGIENQPLGDKKSYSKARLTPEDVNEIIRRTREFAIIRQFPNHISVERFASKTEEPKSKAVHEFLKKIKSDFVNQAAGVTEEYILTSFSKEEVKDILNALSEAFNTSVDRDILRVVKKNSPTEN